jgi:GT2 family glycosyltransferase
MKKTVSAVVITFNRLNFLKDIISSLRHQTYAPEKIFVVNNSSSDGTGEWLAGQDDLIVINQPNLGSSGGQYTGIKAAFESGADYIWTMDDDVLPEKDCLEKLMEFARPDAIFAPLRIADSGEVYINDTISLNLERPFCSIWDEIISKKHLDKEIIPAEGITFEGPLMPRDIVAALGFPEKKFFIYADDTEYFVRAAKNDIKSYIVRDAKLHRRLPGDFDPTRFGWKHYYIIRNIISIDVLHGNFAVRWLRPFAYLVSWLGRCRKPADIGTTLRAFVDGYFYRSDNPEYK